MGKSAEAISFWRQKEFRLMDVGSLNPVGGSIPGGGSCEMGCQNSGKKKVMKPLKTVLSLHRSPVTLPTLPPLM